MKKKYILAKTTEGLSLLYLLAHQSERPALINLYEGVIRVSWENLVTFKTM